MTNTERSNANTTQDYEGYWIQHPADDGYIPVSREAYVLAERYNGFNNTTGRPDEPATASFNGPGGVRGTTMRPDNVEKPRTFDPDHNYYTRAGKPFTLTEWAEQMRTDRILCEDEIDRPAGKIWLRTMYLGLVDPGISVARLYGAIVIDAIPVSSNNILAELETYDSATQAYVGHIGHLAAIQLNYHCRLCRLEGGTDTANYLND